MRILRAFTVLTFLLAPPVLLADALDSLHDLFKEYGREASVANSFKADGKSWQLLKFWSVDCGICRAQVPVVSDMHSDAEQTTGDQKDGDSDYRLRVMGISVDALSREGEVLRYKQRYPSSYPNIQLPLIVINAWFESVALEPFRGTPTYLLFDPQGNLAAMQTSILKQDSLRNFIARYKQ